MLATPNGDTSTATHRPQRSRPRRRAQRSEVQALTGQPLTAETIGRAADLAAAAAKPRSDHRGSAEYKRHMVATFVERILSRSVPATERAA